MKLSLVIPYIDNYDITKRCVEVACQNAGSEFDLILIDNGSDKNHFHDLKKIIEHISETTLVNIGITGVLNAKNIGVLPSFKQGFEESDTNIIGFIHNDVLLHEPNWVRRVEEAFESTPKLGLAGIFGAVGVGDNGGRVRSQSNILGQEWGACECHPVAWQHHSEHLTGVSPATILDGVGMFFSREAANSLMETDMFADWRAPHHFYDRIMPLKLIDKGFKIATIGLGFDHWSGATANSSEKYTATGIEWLKSQGLGDDTQGVDAQIYAIAEKQFFDEFRHRLSCTVDSEWNYHFQGAA